MSIGELKEPIWEKQTWEDGDWHIKFVTYYLKENEEVTAKEAAEKWCKVSGIKDPFEIEEIAEKWEERSILDSWIERSIAYADRLGQIEIRKEISVIKEYKDQGLKSTLVGLRNANEMLVDTQTVVKQYLEQTTDEQGKIDLEVFDCKDYHALVKAQKMAAETTTIMLKVGAEMLGLEEMLERMIEGDVIDA